MIGAIQLHTKDDMNKNCLVGYVIGPKYQRQGYGKEALERIINFAFLDLDYHRVEARVVTTNTPSIKLIESIGMEFEGIRKEDYKLGDIYYDEKIYSLLNNKHNNRGI